MAPSLLSFRGLVALTALCGLALAEKAEPLAQGDGVLSPRQGTCRTPGWIPACPGAFPCIPPGGICCDDGITYVMPPRTCPSGTSPIATAVTSGAASTITAAPTTLPPVTLTQYEWYTWTIRVTYYYYYYTYFAFSASLTSSRSTYSTTGSLTASNDAAATALISSIGASITSSVEAAAQTATPTVGDVPKSSAVPSTTVAPTATATTLVPTAPTTAVFPPAGNTTVPVPPVAPTSRPTEFTGAATSVRRGGAAFVGSFPVAACVMGMMMPGVLMVWL